MKEDAVFPLTPVQGEETWQQETHGSQTDEWLGQPSCTATPKVLRGHWGSELHSSHLQLTDPFPEHQSARLSIQTAFYTWTTGETRQGDHKVGRETCLLRSIQKGPSQVWQEGLTDAETGREGKSSNHRVAPHL